MLLTHYNLLLNLKITSGKCNLFIVGDSHIKRTERDLIVHQLSDKNISLKCKNFDGADVRRIQYHLLPSLHKDQIDSIIIHDGTNDISNNKLHTTTPHNSARKIINISNVFKSLGIAKIAISSVLPCKNLKLQKHVVETNNYLKDSCGFYGFSLIGSSNITENYLHHDEIHLNKVGSLLLVQNFVSHFNKSFWHDENISIESNLQIANSGNLFASNPNHVDVSDT